MPVLQLDITFDARNVAFAGEFHSAEVFAIHVCLLAPARSTSCTAGRTDRLLLMQAPRPPPAPPRPYRRQHRLSFQRPVNADRRLIPRDGPLMLGRVVVGRFVKGV